MSNKEQNIITSVEALNNDRILLRTVIDNLPIAVFAKDLNFRHTLTNKADLQNLGFKEEKDLIGLTVFDVLPEEAARFYHENDLKVLTTGQSVTDQEEIFYDANGNKNWILTSKLPLRNDQGEIIGLVGIGQNITVRKNSELLHNALYEISEAAHHANDMYALYKKIHEIISTLITANNFYIALYDEEADLLSFPYVVDELDPQQEPIKPGKGCTEYVLRNGKAILISETLFMEMVKNEEIVLIGAPSPVWMGAPLIVDNKTIGVIAVQDYNNPNAYDENDKQLLIFISVQIAQVIERKRKEEELKALNSTKDKLFSIIAHDLRGPLGPIINFTELLNEDIDSLNKNQISKIAATIHNASTNILVLMDNLLEWAKMQRGLIKLNPVKINLKEKTGKVMKNLAAKAGVKFISLNNNVDESFDITADQQMLYSILNNLIVNAIKFTNNGGAVTVDAKEIDSFLEISVMDNGVGMTEEQMKNIFRLDTHSSTPGTNKEKGTGLGLMICKDFIKKHGGTIRVESTPGKGSSFIFTIPF